MAFSILTKLCNDHLEDIFVTPQRNPVPIGNYSSFFPTSFPSSPGQPSVSIDLLMLDVSYKRNYITQGLLRLASLLSMFLWFTHVGDCVSIAFLLTAKFIAEYSIIWTCHFCLPTHKLMDVGVFPLCGCYE